MIFKSIFDLTKNKQTEEQAVASMFRMISGLSIREACRMFKVTKNQKLFFHKCIKPMYKPANCDITLETLMPNMLAVKIVLKKINEFNEEDFK
jgi:hypothetical protein